MTMYNIRNNIHVEHLSCHIQIIGQMTPRNETEHSSGFLALSIPATEILEGEDAISDRARTFKGAHTRETSI